MACLKIQRGNTIIVLPESPDLNVRGMIAGDKIIGTDMQCGEILTYDDLESLVTSDGLMVGNLVKAVTNKLGIKQCLACKGRQRNLNARGLQLQKKLKDLF